MPSKNTVSSSEIKKSSSDRKILLFELSVGGHYPAYIKHLVKYWQKHELPGSLDIVVSPQFMQQHADVVDLEWNGGQNVNFRAIAPEEQASLSSRKSRISRASRTFEEWQILRKYATRLEATHCLITYFDTRQLPLALGAKLPCPFSGIYFRPTFHYSDFASYIPSWKDRLQQWREKLLLSQVLRHPQLHTLFCLDPFVVKYIDQFQSRVKAIHLPDPVEISNNSEVQVEKLREKLGIDPSRQIFLLFGGLTNPRKGVSQLLEAVSILPAPLCQKLCLVFAGQANSTGRVSLESQIEAVCQSQPVQIIRRYEYMPEPEVFEHFQLADVVLAPYQRHVGMSGILLQAAAAQKPVLSSNYGLMGEIVHQYKLGLAVDSTVPDELARGLKQFLLESPERFGDRTKMKSFAQQNSAERFASVIFEYI
ncbi:MAG: glycosyl transferase family 1 [Cyanobacteria bacterium QH_8_48_120]|jgi:glycosyltransferase involved in cell wall biosynthesis|nr:MAG: glycosyl transferase family 1 [Cyanobacteria bacterium QH_1_48_107]PSO55828.1 MAG: glycosyl transferase family 1 [Cyanobacteria bacterium QH_10_48_56]PSO60397.1 MAG: glycosyl transferase family 1 [Cyanobacteria bacterium QH_7_48_89]PSO69164.1 MAG: glycosyl transferase family 1 [Cyanobacteria bacterium QH_6_48_35]PSO72466.1 MAG: glycosyl transferase family 1 [Cyanobacteria bacterium QH_3_48_40]PSO74317.1 MAG: glycosyl transferase family 1 [Cyanobacteria bacterium QH_8_48_120]PSO81571.1